MIRVMLVDDEAIARINLKTLLDWEAEGFHICAEAENGADALRELQSARPDVIFTDMHMAGLNGVDLIRQAKGILPEARFVAVSGFDDFDYVRQSMKEGALDYMIKHRMEEETLRSLLASIREDLEQVTLEQARTEQLVAMANSGRAYARRNALLNLLNGYVREDFERFFGMYALRLGMRNHVVSVAAIDHFQTLRERYSAAEFTVFRETLDDVFDRVCAEVGGMEHVSPEEDRHVFLLSFEGCVSESAIHDRLMANLRLVEGTGKRLMNLSLRFGVGRVHPRAEGIPESYAEAVRALEGGYYRGSGYMVLSEDLPASVGKTGCTGLSAEERKQLVAGLRDRDRDGVLSSLDRIFLGLRERKVSFQAMKIVCVELVGIHEGLVQEKGLASEDAVGEPVRAPAGAQPDAASLYEESVRFRSMDELAEWFRLLFTRLLDRMGRELAVEGATPLVRKAIEYMRAHCGDDLSLADVARFVNLSPPYLSKLLGDECGKGFSACLGNIRVERAKQLMRQRMAMREISERTGFRNYTYFCTVFKSLTGMTPQQYEKTLDA